MENSGFDIRNMNGSPDDRRAQSAPLARKFPRTRAPKSSGRPPSDGRGLFARMGAAIVGTWRWLVETKRRLGWRQFLLRTMGIGILLGILYVGFLWLTLPNLDDPASLFAAQSTIITDRNGIELYRLYNEEDRTYIPGDQISPFVKKAIVSIEDSRFYTRGCLDIRALARVLFRLGGAGGASTLTRQLARNALDLQHENLISRKLKELILGCQMERRYDREKILELYLNWIPFGQNAYGVEQASQRFFGVNAKDLTLAQSAILASLPQLPSYYSPYGRHVRTTVNDATMKKILNGTITNATQISNEDVSIGLLGGGVGSGGTIVYVGGRVDQVLFNMEDQGYITAEEKTKALDELQTIEFKASRESIRAPHFVLWVKEQVEKMYEQAADQGLLEQGGLTIETTLDWKLQQEAERAVESRKADYTKLYGAKNIALVSVDPVTREILAYVGNSGYNDNGSGSKIDMAQVPRQPGSSFKPFVYASAFQKGYGPGTVLYDIPTKFGSDEPDNYDGSFWGLTNIRKSLGGSRNIPAIKAYFLGGEEDAILQLVNKMGVPSMTTFKDVQQASGRDFNYGWPLALGAGEAPLVEMVNGFATFAAEGKYKPLIGIRKITRNKVLLPTPFDAELERQPEEVMDPRIAYEVTSILSDVSARPGEFWAAALSVPGTQAAAKTGTSNKECPQAEERSGKCRIKPNNLWTMGYTPTLVTGVWVGNADSTPMTERADGLNVAAPVWKDYMTAAGKILKPSVTTFRVPEGIVQPQISQLSAQLPTECTPVDKRSSDIFLRENAPTLDDPACVQLEVDKVTNLLASDSCPAEAREIRSFLKPIEARPASPSVSADWDRAIKAWTDKQKGTATGSVAGLPIAPTEMCDISLTPGRLVRPTASIIFPSNGEEVGYPSFQPKTTVYVGDKIQSVSYTVDGKPVGTFSEAPFRGTVRVPKSVSKGGTHTLEVTVTDNYFNQVTDSVQFTFGDVITGPTVQILSPTSGTLLKKTGSASLLINVDAGDTGAGVKYVEFYLDGTLLTRRPKEPYNVDYPLTGVSPGEHTIRAVATDLNGQSEEDQVTITVE